MIARVDARHRVEWRNMLVLGKNDEQKWSLDIYGQMVRNRKPRWTYVPDTRSFVNALASSVHLLEEDLDAISVKVIALPAS